MRKTTLAFAMLCSLVGVAHAEDRKGGYLGLKAGYAKYDHTCEPAAVECDRSSSGYGIFGGYDFNHRFGLEMAFTDIGESSAIYPEIRLDGEISAFDISAKYTRRLFGETQVFAKAGAAYWQGEVKGWGVNLDGSGFSPTLGVGVAFPLARHFSARLEYQHFGKVGDSDLGRTQPSFLSLGLTWHFSSRAVAEPYPESFLPYSESFLPDEPESAPQAHPEAESQLAGPKRSPKLEQAGLSSANDSSSGTDSSSATDSASSVELPTVAESSAGQTGADSATSAKTTTDLATASDDEMPALETAAAPEEVELKEAETARAGPVVIDDHSSSPLFAKGSSVLKINYPLEQIAVDLLRNPHLFVHIIVHTDDQGDRVQNQQLSKARADKLADYLIWQGVNPDHITVEGKGETSPLVEKNTETARARNRRAEFFISQTRRRK